MLKTSYLFYYKTFALPEPYERVLIAHVLGHMLFRDTMWHKDDFIYISLSSTLSEQHTPVASNLPLIYAVTNQKLWPVSSR